MCAWEESEKANVPDRRVKKKIWNEAAWESGTFGVFYEAWETEESERALVYAWGVVDERVRDIIIDEGGQYSMQRESMYT